VRAPLRYRFGLLAVCTLLAISLAQLMADKTPQASKDATPGDNGKPQGTGIGSLVIAGGGSLPDSIRLRFLDLAGGKKARLVVIPTASELAHKTGRFWSFEYWKAQPAETVTLLHTLDPEKANDPTFVKPLTEATGVWLSGGDQARLTAAYRGTAVMRELRKLLDRGGVVGGTSAGAAAMSSLMILSGNPGAKVGVGLDLLDDVVIDQHFHNRNRLKRLQGVLDKHPAYMGLGIDEETAVVLKGRKATVLGNANVRVCLPMAVGKLPMVQVLKAGDELDLAPLCQAVRELCKSTAAATGVRDSVNAARPPRPRKRRGGEGHTRPPRALGTRWSG
jgi:cyanophycinase